MPNTEPSTVTVQSLGSGSSGNAFLVTTATNTLLIDCGVGIRTITKALRERHMALADIDAVCVTHEHSDHIRTLPKVIHSELELYATLGTARRSAIPSSQHTSALEDRPVTIAGITIWPMPVAHDAIEPCGFMAEMPDGTRVTMLTDLGSWHDSLRDFVRASDLIILEANHDEEMLRCGPYPTYLKRRVASDVGHLSNRHCGIALGEALRGTTHRPEIWLAHLSEHNNRPGLAEETVREALAKSDLDLAVTALPRTSPGEIWTPPLRERSVTPFQRHRALEVQQLGFDLF
jgi:phosphoribosyl 1,2-cyclic phosphodiesterase